MSKKREAKSSKVKTGIAFFDAKDYDIASFDEANKDGEFEIKYFDTKLTPDTVKLAKGYDAVCVFVNDTVNKKVINALTKKGVRLVALRCAGFNNVDIKQAAGQLGVVRVPAYSPYAVAEHAIALLLTSVRRIHKAYNRTREFNFSLSGLTGFDFHGKTVGVIG
ncbi:MAG: 2-hydroxyacid dehydrogenase, partial [Lachnospiraceae bacterium]|nr:2-hydroxyacid dehydrogenase [Lachnospiraceae bacterium]